MNPANTSNASSSATTSSSARKTPRPGAAASDPEAASAKLSEAEFLEQQASAAKAAIAGAFAELKTDLAKGVDPRIWMKSHPWLTLASVTAAGFAAAATVVPSKEQQALRKLEAIERALHAGREAKEPSLTNGDGKKKEHGGMLAMLLHELFGALKPAILALIASHFSPPAAAEEYTDDAGDASRAPLDPPSAG